MQKILGNIETTVNNDLCVGCGICEGACPYGAISIHVKNGEFRPTVNAELCRNEKGCHRCATVCPGLGIRLTEMAENQFKDEAILTDKYVGRYLQYFTGYSSDRELRYRAASGGLVSQFLIFLLETKYIDGAVVTAFDSNSKLLVRTYIAHTKEEILAAKSSKYAPVTFDKIVTAIKEDSGSRFIIVGLPCHIHGFRKLEQIDRKFHEKIVGYFGLYCSGGRTFYLTEHIFRAKKIQKEKLTYLAYREEGSLGSMIMREGEKVTKEPFKNYYTIRRSFFYPRRCLFCIDHYAELADICFGDVTTPPYTSEKIGISSVVIRSSEFLKLLLEAKNSGAISLDAIDFDILKASQRMALVKKGRNAAFVSLVQKFGGLVPEYDTLKNTKITPLYVLKYIHIGIQRFLGRHKNLWFLVDMLMKKPKGA